jgi:hypothetical protein
MALSAASRQQSRDLDGTFGRHHAEFRGMAAQALIAWVRWPTSISRYLRMMPSAC